jgi:pyridoxamine 5'-phosphate oxidase
MDADWPLRRFEEWMGEAAASEPNDPNAMTLATADAQGRPSARIVLLKGVDARGFVFYSNAESRKGQELAANPRVALLFHWKTLARQVRVEGEASPVSDAEADAYFASRGRLSQLGAWASEQSRPLADRGALLARIEALEARYPGEVPRPPHWRGWRVAPVRIEFWRDRPGRLHEREVFVREREAWTSQLLFP